MAGAAAFVLTSGGEETTGTQALPTRQVTPMGSATPTSAGPSVSVLPTDAAVNARNPFLRPPTDSPSPSGSGAGGAGGGGVSTQTVTATRTVVGQGSTATVKKTATVRSTATATSTAVYLALYSITTGTGADALFRVSVNGAAGSTPWTANVGDRFGDHDEFHYTGVDTSSGSTCAVVAYVDETVHICAGEMAKVH
ncbi:MAG: hypothetical protein U0Q15_19005 [Kineosporiaceae bacterium]